MGDLIIVLKDGEGFTATSEGLRSVDFDSNTTPELAGHIFAKMHGLSGNWSKHVVSDKATHFVKQAPTSFSL